MRKEEEKNTKENRTNGLTFVKVRYDRRSVTPLRAVVVTTPITPPDAQTMLR